MKVVIVALGIAAACIFGGCGQKDVAKVETTTADEVKEVVNDVEEAFISTTEEKEVPDVVEEPEVEEEAIKADEVEETVEDVVDATEDLPPISEYAAEQDKSAEYGINSTSSYDLDQYLDKWGRPEWYDDFEGGAYDFFTGKFAYPEVSPCALYDSISIYSMTDMAERLELLNTETGDMTSIVISPGSCDYDNVQELIGTEMGDGDLKYELAYTVDTPDGAMEVVLEQSVMRIKHEDGTEQAMTGYAYCFPIGQYSVQYYAHNTLTEEEVKEVISSVHLVGEQ